jgi:putative heme degradation protein
MNERKGALTPEQEKTLEKLIVLKNKALEAVDGTIVTIVDNLAIEAILDAADKKNPEIREYVYQVVDVIFAGLEAMMEEKE